jgi:hypothetical protein
VALLPGHSYRVQVLVHDGDQSKGGGDTGQACAIFCAGGTLTTGTGGATAPPPATCPTGVAACGGGVIDAIGCAAGTVCANGCCLPALVIP